MTIEENKIGAEAAEASSSQVKRRTILTGAAWSLPVIAMAVAVPAAAVSTSLQLVFNQTSYNGTACAAISGVQVLATTVPDGLPAAPGTPVTVTLSGGYTFADGTTSYAGVAGAGGLVSLPDVIVPPAGGSGSLTASAAGASDATAVVSAPTVTGAAGYIRSGTEYNAHANIPAGSEPVYGALFLTPDGRLISAINGVTYASNVSEVGDGYETSGQWQLPFVRLDGTRGYILSGTERNAHANVPAGSEPVYGALFLTPDGRLISAINGVTYASNVSEVGDGFENGGQWQLPFVRLDGTRGYILNGTERNAHANVPAGSEPVYGALFLTPDGRLISAINGVTYASNVSEVGDGYETSGQWQLPFVRLDGTRGYILSGTERNAHANVPAGSEPVYGALFLTPDGRLISAINGLTYASDVSEVGAGFENGGQWQLPFTRTVSTC